MNNKSNYLVRSVREYFKQNWGILLALLVMCTFFTVFGNNFLTQTNIVNLLRTCATNCYLAIGVQLAIILAGIDLTGGALAALSGVICVMTFENAGLPIWAGIADSDRVLQRQELPAECAGVSPVFGDQCGGDGCDPDGGLSAGCDGRFYL